MKPVEKKSRARNIVIPKPFLNDNNRIVGYFTGTDVEVFDEDSIKTLDETCFGVDPKPRQMMMMNERLKVRRTTKADFNRRLDWREKFCNSTDDTCDDTRAEMTVGEEVVANPYPIPRSLVLFLEEAFFLHHLNHLEVRDLEDKPLPTEELWQKFCKLKATFVECFISYLYLKSKHWVVKGGIKFGGDFLLYKQSPQLFHASFIVIVSTSETLTTQSYHTSERVAETTGKNLLYLEVNIPEDVDQANCLNSLEATTVKEVCIQRHETFSK